jgi:ubiquinone/menaquinone biosynthesis C-methylase UbiE
MKTFSYETDSLIFFDWGRNNPIGKIPKGVAKEGAGENRIPFANLANSVPVYLTMKRILENSKKDNLLVLDIGCGTGRHITFIKDVLKNKKHKFYGIDYSQSCIDFAKDQYGAYGVNFKKHGGNKLPFKDNTFDYIISSHVLEHVSKDKGEMYFSEISRILKKGGTAVIGTPNRKYCQNLFHKNPEDIKKYRLILPHLHEYTYLELANMFLKNKWFSSWEIDQTINKINLKLMKQSIDKIKLKKGFLNKVKFNIYSILRNNPRIQDIMAKVGTEFVLKRMKVDYTDLLKNTYYVKGSKLDNGENFIIIAKK